MGCRGNIQIQFSNKKSIYFYTHWRGDSIREVVQAALRRRQRWGDESYLARMIFCELVKGHESEESGYGIAPYIPDNEHPIVKVIPRTQTVMIGRKSYTFEAFINEDRPEILHI